MASQYVKLPYIAGSSGSVDSFNGRTGVVVPQSADYSASQIANTPSGNIAATNVQAAINELDTEKQDAIAGNNNQLVWRNTVGTVEGSTTYSLDTNNESLQGNLLLEPNGANTNTLLENLYVAVDPQASSPDESATIRQIYVDSDLNDTGFAIGSNGNSYQLDSRTVNHQKTSNLGAISFANNVFTVGNGTDPINFRGVGYTFGFGEVKANVTVTGPIQGHGFQPVVNAAAIMNNSAYVTAFYDFANIGTEVSSYTSFSAGPTIDSIANNTGYTGLNLNPTISGFTGNASTTQIALAGNFSGFGTGGYNGINISPTATGVPYANGIVINMGNVTGSNIKAMDITGDVSINGALSFTGALSIGKLSAYYGANIVDGGGAPTTFHGLISAPTLAANATVANADTIGANTAALMTFNANSTATTNLVGIAALALPAVVQTHTGCSVDLVTGATFAISLDGGSTGGTLDQVSTCRSTAVPNGITTVTKLIGYEFVLPFGDPGTTTWGVHISDAAQNYFEGSVAIGTSETVTNSSVGLELNSTTKAFLPSRMTTTERDALTAVNGMVIYNSTTDKLQVRAAGSWVDLH